VCVCVCVCACVFSLSVTRQSVILAMKNESHQQQDGEAENLVVLSFWADDLGPSPHVKAVIANIWVRTK
jgi:hypothetical protein